MLPFRLPADEDLGDYASFTDETDVSGANFMIIGGVSCRSRYAGELDAQISRLRADARYPDSFQWKNINDRKLDDYIKLVDLFFELNSEHLVDFHAVAFECAKFDHAEYNDGDGELGFYKFVFQSMYSSVGRYRPHKMRCIHGNRTSKYNLVELQKILNNQSRKGSRGSYVYVPFREVKYGAVKTTGPLQMADVLIGALGSAWNKRKGSKTDSSKLQLAEYIRSRSPVNRLNEPSPPWLKHSDIWKFRLKEGPRRPSPQLDAVGLHTETSPFSAFGA